MSRLKVITANLRAFYCDENGMSKFNKLNINNYTLFLEKKIADTPSTDEMLKEIASYKYKCYGFPYVFLDYSYDKNKWCVTWRNPAEFGNRDELEQDSPAEACAEALKFIEANPSFFKRKES